MTCIEILVSIAQIVTATVAIVAVVLSFWVARKTLKEVQRGRIHSQKPFLLFDYGGHQAEIEFRNNKDGEEFICAHCLLLTKRVGFMFQL